MPRHGNSHSNSVPSLGKYELDILLISLIIIVQVYVHLEGDRTNLVQTAWCLMGLMEARQVTLEFDSFNGYFS